MNEKAEEGSYVPPSKFTQVFPLEGNPDGDLFFSDQPFHFSVGSEGRYIYTVGTDARCEPPVPRLIVYDIFRGSCSQYRTPEANPNTKLFHLYCIGHSRALIISKTRRNETIVFLGVLSHRLKTLRLIRKLDEFSVKEQHFWSTARTSANSTLRLIRKLDEFSVKEQHFWSTARTSANSVLAFVCAGGTIKIKEYDAYGIVVDLQKRVLRSMFEFTGQPFYAYGRVHVFLSTVVAMPGHTNFVSVLDGDLGIIDLYSGEVRFEPTKMKTNSFPIIDHSMPNMVKHIHHNGHVWVIAKSGHRTRLGCLHVKTLEWHPIKNWVLGGRADYQNICMDVAQDGKIVALCREHRYCTKFRRIVSAVKWIKVAYTSRVPRSLAMQAFMKLSTSYPLVRRENPLLLHRCMGIPREFVL
uniref:Sema domain-containing protein n=2 Tax=Steinernema glaseri TaxID=37863 RepID=A0A1I7ZXK0_9BILA